MRRSIKDVTVRGVVIPAGKPVFLLLSAANRDPAAWTNADEFDIDRNRTESQNLGLGYGIRSCLGAALARMESAIALGKLLEFMPRYEVDWDSCTRVHMQNVVGWANVPVRVNSLIAPRITSSPPAQRRPTPDGTRSGRAGWRRPGCTPAASRRCAR